MKKYNVTIGYLVRLNIEAKNKKEAEEYAWHEFDNIQPCEPSINISEAKDE